MCQNILVEMRDGSRYLVKIPTSPEKQTTASDVFKAISFRIAAGATAIIDLDKQIFLKNRHSERPEVSHYEMKFFLDGPLEYYAGPWVFASAMKFKYPEL